MLLQPELILLNQTYENKEQAIRACGQLLVDNHCVQPAYVDSMIERDEMVSVYIGNEIAIPHGTDMGRQYINKTGLCVIQVPDGVEFNGQKARILFGIAGLGDEHMDILSKIAIYCSEQDNVDKLLAAQTKEDIIAQIASVED